MPDLRKRVIAGILAVTLILSMVGCNGDDDSPGTTSPGYSETTEPIGS